MPRYEPVLVALLLVPQIANGQVVIADGRRTDWSQAGIGGTIPHRTTICATFSPGATSAQINSAIASCTNGVVYLNAGTYNLSAGLTFNLKDNVTLRGAGPDKTILRIAAPDSCGGVSANICVQGGAVGSSPPASNIRNWTAGFAKGTTLITLDSAPAAAVGAVLVLDQLDDASDTGGVLISCAPSFNLETCPPTRTTRSQQQMVRVVAVNGNQVTISPGLHMPNWRSARQPQAWWWGDSAEMNGIEDLTLDHTSGRETSGIGFRNAYRNWVRNIRSLNSQRNHIWLHRSARIEVRDSYFYGTKSAATLSYGVESFMTSDALVVNNIFQHVSRPIMMGPAAGGVYAYNFMIDNHQSSPPTWTNAGINGSHDSGTGMNLFEGNVTTGFLMDLYHGTGALPTLFRNRMTGTELGKTQNTSVINIWAFNRLANIVGNVLGTDGYHTKYQNSRVAPGTPGSSDRSIYLLGYSGVDEQTPLGHDPLVASTMLRWGNYDYATRQTRWNPAEIPAGSAVPASTALPTSMFLSSRPAWWGTTPWPAIGPDVSGGQDPSGHAHRIPAERCFENSARHADGTLVFNASQCYATAPRDTTPPAVSITAPVSGATVSGTITVNAIASDSLGVAGVQFRLDGVNLGAERTAAPFSISWNTKEAKNGSHSLSAVARDLDGNVGTSAAVGVTVNNFTDTTAPSVPSNLTGSGVSMSQINLSWGASTDDVGVTGYRILRCQGAGCSPAQQIASGGTTAYSDTGLHGGTSYTYAVSAFDAMGNSSAPALVAVVTHALPPQTLGLVAGYGFNEGSGHSTVDESTNQNIGMVREAVWAASGRFGSAMGFNGSSSFVEATDIPSLTPQTDATFQAWVSLNSAPTEVASVLNKWSQTADDEYIFGVNPDRTIYFAWKTTGGATWGTPAYNHAKGTVAIPINKLTHVAVVRTGASLRFYVNGALDVALDTAMDSTPFRDGTTPLRVGGQGRGGSNRFLNGVVDDARIYNRALTQVEIQHYMTTPLPGGHPAAPTNVRVVVK